MTYSFKLARRLAIARGIPALLAGPSLYLLFSPAGASDRPSHGLTDTSRVVVVAPAPALAAVELIPTSRSRFIAQGRLSDGSTVPVHVTLTATGGSIDASGVYTAGDTPGTYYVIASVGDKADTAVVTITEPSNPKTAVGLDSLMLLQPPGAPGKPSLGPSALIDSLDMSPDTITLPAAHTAQFTVSAYLNGERVSQELVASRIEFSTLGGTINPNGFYQSGTQAGRWPVIVRDRYGKAVDTSWVRSLDASLADPTMWDRRTFWINVAMSIALTWVGIRLQSPHPPPAQDVQIRPTAALPARRQSPSQRRRPRPDEW